MKYPVYISRDDNGYYVFLPDFQNFTEGKTLEEAVYMARDAICSLAIIKEELGQTVPPPFSVDYRPGPNERLICVDVDFAAYCGDLTKQNS